jgi:hypothetical protein
MQLHERSCGQEPADGAQATFGLPLRAVNVERVGHHSNGHIAAKALQTVALGGPDANNTE